MIRVGLGFWSDKGLNLEGWMIDQIGLVWFGGSVCTIVVTNLGGSECDMIRVRPGLVKQG